MNKYNKRIMTDQDLNTQIRERDFIGMGWAMERYLDYTEIPLVSGR